MLRGWISRIRGMLLRRRVEDEFSSEIEAHLSLMADDLMRAGMPAGEARREARRQFGGVAQIQQLHREGRGIAALDHAAADLRYALRTMRLNPGFTLLAALTLALGIGVNVTLFSAYNAVALKQLPVADPDRVVRWERWFASHGRGDNQYAFSYPEYRYVREHAHAFSGLAASSWPLRVFAEWGGGGRNRLEGQLVSANYFSAMGVSARLGRGFAAEEDRTPGGNPVVVLSAEAWQHSFQGDPGIVGRSVKLNGTAFTVIGVMPESFTGTLLTPTIPDFWAPLSMQAQLAPGSDWLANADRQSFQILARLAPGSSLPGAQAEAELLLGQFAATHTERDKTTALTLQHTAFFGNTEDPRFQALIAGLMLIVGLVLLVACANIANMLLARGAGRQREIGLRLALGATRGRVVRQLLTESVVLGLAGGALGLLLSGWSSRLLWVAIGSVLPAAFGGGVKLTVDPALDARVYVYALAVSIGAGILFGLSPALQFTRPDLSSSLKDEGTGLGRGWSRSRMRGFLVGSQVALSMLLLITAGLLLRGMTRSRAADPGFDTHTLYVLTADFGEDPAKATDRQRQLLSRLAGTPGVAGISVGSVPMLGTWTPPMVAGRSAAHAGELCG